MGANTTYCCTFPGCGVLVKGSRRCPNHQRNNTRNGFDGSRGTRKERGYGHDWTKVRNRYVKAHPLCELCLSSGKTVAVAEVHHKVPIDVNPALRLVPSNLQSLCKSCHASITANRNGNRPSP